MGSTAGLTTVKAFEHLSLGRNLIKISALINSGISYLKRVFTCSDENQIDLTIGAGDRATHLQPQAHLDDIVLRNRTAKL